MMRNNIKIAITGGIGSGKSETCSVIRQMGFAVYSCDEIYSELLADKFFLDKLAEEFGENIIVGGALDRGALSKIVFSDKQALKRLDSLTHPAILNRYFTLSNEEKLSFCEVPLLFENGLERKFDGVIVILRNRDMRIASVVKRSGISANEVEKRINSQYNYDNSDFAKYYVIHNDCNLEYLSKQIEEVIKKIREKFNF